MGEFDFISRHFRPLAGEGAFELRNDGAVLSLPSDYELVISSDTMVENRHFLPIDPPETVGQKLLRCNLSDIAAMGAEPVGYTLNISVPLDHRYDEKWFAAFSSGLAKDQKAYGLSLLGGDTTGIEGPLVLSVTIFGRVLKGQALRRDQALPGDGVWVTGQLGAAALGLYARLGKLEDPSGKLMQAYLLPQPCLGLPLYGVVTTAMDISDGVMQDAGHIAEESGVKIILYASRLPFDTPVREVASEWEAVKLMGGDDYQLLMTCPPENEQRLQQICRGKGVKVSRIGDVRAGKFVEMLADDGQKLSFKTLGWQHF
ncbi:thiamine-phosphate kinase [Acetobacteraceae bacterium ESL0709]|nr:thiamine-phosphate kinase [Acetobacteraceae bacterium ESL0697]MDF7678040.1 thiamine-phosphate kinase [Acetobacteraceae bacterium ESL0709]